MAENKIIVATHNFKFHADDIFAVATLSIVFEKEGRDFSVVRTRDQNIIDSADFVLDVGGVYDTDRNRFDHHQTGGAGKRDNGIPYAAFGLVWKKYGELLSGNTAIASKIDRILVQPIDALDNALQFVRSDIPNVYPYTISSYVDAFVPSWKEDWDTIDITFMKMVSMAKDLLNRELSKEKDREEAYLAVEKAYYENEDKRLIILERPYPSSEVLSRFPEPLFVVAPRNDGRWNIKTIVKDQNLFLNRKDLPKEWSGKFGEEFEKVSGVKGANFCHHKLYLAGAETKEAILKLAQIALNS